MKENWKDKAALKVANALLSVQSRFAKTLEKKTENVSTKHVQVVVIFFCLIWCGLSSLYITQAILLQGKSSISIEPIRLPKHSIHTGEPRKSFTDTIKSTLK